MELNCSSERWRGSTPQPQTATISTGSSATISASTPATPWFCDSYSTMNGDTIVAAMPLARSRTSVGNSSGV
jgi:hypothetical protein